MVSADNLPFDILPLIFHFLSSGTDLAAVVLVSKSFSSGVLPLIYDTINVRMSLVKRLGNVQSPFRTLNEHPDLQPFVRRITIQTLTCVRLAHDPNLLLQITKALPRLSNLETFTFTVASPTAPLSPMLPSLVALARLREVKLIAEHINVAQAELLSKIGSGTTGSEGNKSTSTDFKGLEEIWLKSPSSAVMCVLKTWIQRNQNSLRRLTIVESHALSVRLLGDIVSLVPDLTVLNISHCPDVEHWGVMQMLVKIPSLRSLSLHVLTHNNSPTPIFMHTGLKHLAISFTTSHAASVSQLRTTLNGFLSFVSASGLESFTIESTELVLFPVSAITTLVQNHGTTLRRFNALQVTVEHDALEIICKGCLHLEQICMGIGIEIKTASNSVTAALSKSKSLHTLVDSSDIKPHRDHTSSQVRLNNIETKNIFLKVPTLKRIINANRCWTRLNGKFSFAPCQAQRINHFNSPILSIRP